MSNSFDNNNTAYLAIRAFVDRLIEIKDSGDSQADQRVQAAGARTTLTAELGSENDASFIISVLFNHQAYIASAGPNPDDVAGNTQTRLIDATLQRSTRWTRRRNIAAPLLTANFGNFAVNTGMVEMGPGSAQSFLTKEATFFDTLRIPDSLDTYQDVITFYNSMGPDNYYRLLIHNIANYAHTLKNGSETYGPSSADLNDAYKGLVYFLTQATESAASGDTYHNDVFNITLYDLGLLIQISNSQDFIPRDEDPATLSNKSIHALQRVEDSIDASFLFGEENQDIPAPDRSFPGAQEQTIREGQDIIEGLLAREQCVLSHLTPRILARSEIEDSRNQDNIIMLNDTRSDELVGRITGRPQIVDFFNLSSDEISLLMPRIAIYKHLFTRDGSGRLEEVPVGEGGLREFKFDTFFDPDDIAKITNTGRGRGRGIGLKSLSWDFEGTNPEEIISFLKCDMSFFVQNVEDLFPRDVATTPDLFTSNSGELPLIQLFAAGLGGDGDDPAAEALNFSIKLLVGWQLDSRVQNNLSSARLGRLKEIVDFTSIWLELKMYEHNIDFGDDGTCTLNLSFFAGIDAHMNNETMNVLKVGSAQQGGNLGAALIARAVEEQGVTPEAVTSRRSGARTCLPGEEHIDGGGSGADDDELSPQEVATITSIRAYAGSNENVFNNYRTLFNRITNSGHVYKLTIDREAFISEVLGDPDDESEETLQERAQEAMKNLWPDRGAPDIPGFESENSADVNEDAGIEAFRVLTQYMSIDNLTTLGFDLEREEYTNRAFNQALQSARDQAVEMDDTEALQHLAEFNYQEQINLALAERLIDNETYSFNFIRLGNLLDALIQGLKETEGTSINVRQDMFRFISTLNQYRNHRGVIQGVNYSDILISVNSFREFFIEKIVRRLRTNFPLRDFIIDLVTKFSYASSIRQCDDLATAGRISTPAISVIQASPRALIDETATGGLYRDLTDLLTSALTGGSAPSDLVEIPELVDFFIIGSSTSTITPLDEADTDPTDQFARPGETIASPWAQADARRGVHHIYIGSDRSIVKNINFRRDQIPGLREARIVRGGGFNLSVFREKYDISLTLFGTPFIYPGTFIFLSTETIGLGFGDSPYSASRLLGLGGYYFVNKVSNRIDSEGGYETTVEATWNAFADGLDEHGCQAPAVQVVPSSALFDIVRATETAIGVASSVPGHNI